MKYSIEVLKHIAIFFLAFVCVITASYGISNGCSQGEHFYIVASCLSVVAVIVTVIMYIRKNIINK